MGDVIEAEGKQWRRDPDADTHEPGVMLLLMRWGIGYYREIPDLTSAISEGDATIAQIDYRATGVADYAPVAVIAKDGTVLHAWD